MVPILSEPMFDVNPKKTAMTPKDLLLYCYYGGMIHIGQHHPEVCVPFLSLSSNLQGPALAELCLNQESLPCCARAPLACALLCSA